MLKSLFSGVSGLQSHQVAMDVESNNIANVNTTGFKYSRANFSDLLAQTSSIATAPQGELGGKNAVQVGLGSTVSSMTRIFSQGSIQNSDKNTDVAIQGDGFFIISPDGGSTYKYTRAGDFKFDANGNFVDNNGFISQGWLRDEDTGKVDSTAPIQNINIAPGLTTPASPTQEVVLKANLNSGTTVTSYSQAYAVPSGTPPSQEIPAVYTGDAVDAAGAPIASGNLGVMFNEVGEAFSLQANQGVWASFLNSEVTAANNVVSGPGELDITFKLDDGTYKQVITTGGALTNTEAQNGSRYVSAINAQSAVTGISATYDASNNKINLVNDNSNANASHNINISSIGNANGGFVVTSDTTAYKYQYNPSGSDASINADKTFTTMADLRYAMEQQARAVGDHNATTYEATNVVTAGDGIAITESATITMPAMVNTDTITIDGITLSASGPIAAADVATAFATGIAPANGVFSGSDTGDWGTPTADGTSITLSSTTAERDVANIIVYVGGTLAAITPTITPGDSGEGATFTIAGTTITVPSGGGSIDENNVVTFPAIGAGKIITIGGLTLTATSSMSATEVAAAYASASNGVTPPDPAKGTFTGSLSGWSSGGATGTDVTFTSNSSGINTTDLVFTGAIADNVKTEGVPGLGGTTENNVITFGALTFGESVTIDGMTLTVTDAGGMLDTEVAAAFASVADAGTGTATKGIFTGSLSGWSSGAAAGAVVTFTSSAGNADVTDLATSLIAGTDTEATAVKIDGGSTADDNGLKYAAAINNARIAGVTATYDTGTKKISIANTNTTAIDLVVAADNEGLTGFDVGTTTIEAGGDGVSNENNIEIIVNDQGKFEITNPGGSPDGDYDMNLKITALRDIAAGITENVKFTTNLTALNAVLPSGSTGKAYSQSFNAATHSSSIDIFDSLGSKHTLRMEMRKTALDSATGSTWDLKLSVPLPASIDTIAPYNEKTGSIRFNNDGSLATFNPPNVSFSGNNGSSPDQQVNINFGTANAFDGMTSFDSKSSTSGISQDGFTGGDIVGIRIDQSGTVIGSFSNGRSFGLAQIAMAKFTNNEGLATEGGNIYVQTSNSGDPIIGTAATSGRGFIQSSALEASNVDLSRALTQLIIIQRGYQANGKTITTSDQLLQTLIGLKN